MTEFAITLPIFLAFFALLMGLGNSVQGMIHAQTQPAPHLWEEVYEAPNDLIRNQPSTGVAADPPTEAPVTAGPRAAMTAGAGHWGESYYQSRIAMPLATGESAPNDVRSMMTMRSSNVVGDSIAGQGVASDDYLTTPWTDMDWDPRGNNIASWVGIGIGAVGWGIQMSQAQLALGAGTRYGDVIAGAETDIEPGYGVPDFHQGTSYTSRISPSPDGTELPGSSTSTIDDFLGDSETRAFAFARINANLERPYREMLNIADAHDDTNRMDPWASQDVPDL